jgi:adenosylmethionine-8-amino-7-oxononanoate aminotransferase
LASIHLLSSPEILERRAYIENAHKKFAATIEKHPKVKEVRCLGVIIAVDLNLEMERYGNLRDQLYRFFMDRGVLLRPLGNTVYVLPPYVITNEQLEKVYQSIKEVLEVF